ncbi:PaaI family thioesterase [Pseudomonas cavernae]|uniref:PaaI family thioesterase n=1 Tax=Pseudomonas cavernae TaxID=2320867 RepID=A0A385Z4K1_9PSED|nr:PaaI family thioesterase [Pseudomonas cavernae]AYC34056.1 PaaI family thioesterase [Pseudomonas cavernae]
MQSSREEKLAAWRAAEQAIRGRLAAPGTLSLAEVSALPPLEFFTRIGNGELPSPPFGELVDFVPLEWSPGRFVFQGRPDARHYNPLGSVHGGYAASLLDSCMGCAIHTQLQPGQGYTTTDLRISYVRALRGDSGPVRAEGRIVHLGRSTALAEGRIYDVDDRLYAVGSCTCLILDMSN